VPVERVPTENVPLGIVPVERVDAR